MQVKAQNLQVIMRDLEILVILGGVDMCNRVCKTSGDYAEDAVKTGALNQVIPGQLVPETFCGDEMPFLNESNVASQLIMQS